MSQLSRTALILLLALALPLPAVAERGQYMDLARRGWVYELRSAVWQQDPLVPAIRIHGKLLAGASLCLVGEPPHPRTAEVLDAFRALMAEVFAKPLPQRFAGPDLSLCGTGRTVYIRLYSGRIPHAAYNADLRRMDEIFVFGLPPGSEQYVMSPAQAQAFFGRRGPAVHVMVKQPAPGPVTPLQQAFFASILIEEMYQAFSFGMDVLHLEREAAFMSKLEEYPVNLRGLPWASEQFMEGLLRSNPRGLCWFDVFMLHAVAGASVERTNSDAFLAYIDSAFDRLAAQTEATLGGARFGVLFDAACRGAPD